VRILRVFNVLRLSGHEGLCSIIWSEMHSAVYLVFPLAILIFSLSLLYFSPGKIEFVQYAIYWVVPFRCRVRRLFPVTSLPIDGYPETTLSGFSLRTYFAHVFLADFCVFSVPGRDRAEPTADSCYPTPSVPLLPLRCILCFHTLNGFRTSFTSFHVKFTSDRHFTKEVTSCYSTFPVVFDEKVICPPHWAPLSVRPLKALPCSLLFLDSVIPGSVLIT